MKRHLLSSLSVPVILVATAIFPMTAGCSSVQHATRPGVGLTARDASLVEVKTTGLDSGYRVVSFSSWDILLTDELPEAAPEDVVISMREAAATHGAEMLLVDRWDDPYRKAFYGMGVVPAEGGAPEVKACDHVGFSAALTAVQSKARSCAKRIKKERPAIAGTVEAVFEVDPNGGILRAAATPNSSRDSGLQGCVIDPIYASQWGTPTGFTCKGTITVDLNKLD